MAMAQVIRQHVTVYQRSAVTIAYRFWDIQRQRRIIQGHENDTIRQIGYNCLPVCHSLYHFRVLKYRDLEI